VHSMELSSVHLEPAQSFDVVPGVGLMTLLSFTMRRSSTSRQTRQQVCSAVSWDTPSRLNLLSILWMDEDLSAYWQP
jgi:hypothetical protein